ncbi:hypothetical protein CASFOL_026080 [Castilleja foliolosa]|uniref:Small ribosomal subunit protein uS15c n=1 Tax=Castilleja foliolosa TaxID=1961234 RepID=A0ABD3CSX5_9LAMI
MAAITQRLLRLRPAHGHHPYPIRHFSSSDAPPPSEPKPEPEPEPGSPPPPSFSSYFNDVKASLQREPPPQNRPQTPRKPLSFSTPPPPPSPQTSPPSRFEYLDEIRRNLSEFRTRSASPPPSPSPSVSLQELYNRHAAPNNKDPSATGDSKPPTGPSFSPIRDSLRNLRSPTARNQSVPQGRAVDQLSLSRLKESLKLNRDEKADQGSTPIVGGSDGLPSIFDKEVNKSGDDSNGAAMRTQFVKMYNHSELGAKLQKLRPEKRKGNWFSLHELNERLAKLRLIEEKESKVDLGGVTFTDLRETLAKLSRNDHENTTKKKNTPRLEFLGRLGGTPSFMLSPPKDELVEKYFHPDNMSSAEKLKLELKKVRDEFKISESDCGSARVQVAQLTTKILHLSAVLKKKDKHSRRGLEAMVERRQKLLKYLRRTDWDSFCLLLAKFDLRDNTDKKSERRKQYQLSNTNKKKPRKNKKKAARKA